MFLKNLNSRGDGKTYVQVSLFLFQPPVPFPGDDAGFFGILSHILDQSTKLPAGLLPSVHHATQAAPLFCVQAVVPLPQWGHSVVSVFLTEGSSEWLWLSGDVSVGNYKHCEKPPWRSPDQLHLLGILPVPRCPVLARLKQARLFQVLPCTCFSPSTLTPGGPPQFISCLMAVSLPRWPLPLPTVLVVSDICTRILPLSRTPSNPYSVLS